MADELGYAERYIGQLERGTKSPTLRSLADIAKVFSTEVSAIFRAAERRQRAVKSADLFLAAEAHLTCAYLSASWYGYALFLEVTT